MRSSSSGVGSRSSLPMTRRRMVPCPAKTAQFGLMRASATRARCRPIGHGDAPSLPSVSVVTPCSR